MTSSSLYSPSHHHRLPSPVAASAIPRSLPSTPIKTPTVQLTSRKRRWKTHLQWLPTHRGNRLLPTPNETPTRRCGGRSVHGSSRTFSSEIRFSGFFWSMAVTSRFPPSEHSRHSSAGKSGSSFLDETPAKNKQSVEKNRIGGIPAVRRVSRQQNIQQNAQRINIRFLGIVALLRITAGIHSYRNHLRRHVSHRPHDFPRFLRRFIEDETTAEIGQFHVTARIT